MELLFSYHKQTKYILYNILFFAVFMIIYTVLDLNANDTYTAFLADYGMTATVLHVGMNVLNSLVSSVVMTWSFISLKVYKKDVKGSNIPFIGVVLGFLTFGCTPCVVSFLSIFGISFVPIILPDGNLLFKVLVFVILLVSGYLTQHYFKKGCNVSLD